MKKAFKLAIDRPSVYMEHKFILMNVRCKALVSFLKS